MKNRNEKLEHFELAKNCVVMAIHELQGAEIVMINDKCWCSAMNAGVALYQAYEMLKNTIKGMEENERFTDFQQS